MASNGDSGDWNEVKYVADVLSEVGQALGDADNELKLDELKVKELGEDFPYQNSEDEYIPGFQFQLKSPQHFASGDGIEIQNLPRGQYDPSRIYGLKHTVSTKPKSTPKKKVPKKTFKNDDTDDDDSPPLPNPAQSKKVPGGSKSSYQDYVYSEAFIKDSIKKTFETCSKLAEEENQELMNFWKDNIIFLLKLIADNHLSVAHRIKSYIRGGFDKLCTIVEGVQMGVEVGKASVNTKIIEDLGGLSESMATTNSRIIKEYKAHVQQAQEFIHQISASSKVVADLQYAVEQIKLINLKSQLLPDPTHLPGVVTVIPPLDEHYASTDDSQMTPSRVKELSADGTYKCNLGTIKILDRKVSSWVPSSSEFAHFKVLVGRPIDYAVLICNFDHVAVSSRMKSNPEWLTTCFLSNNRIDKEKLKLDLKGLSKKQYQWSRINAN